MTTTRRIALALALGAIGLIVAAQVIGGEPAAHATFHGLSALVITTTAGLLAWRNPAGRSATVIAVLAGEALAAAWLVEGVGAFGYGSDGYTRANGLVALHDLGAPLTLAGLLSTAVGAPIAIAARLTRDMAAGGRRVAMRGLIAAALIASALLVVATMVGIGL
jgi:hypothetical protein